MTSNMYMAVSALVAVISLTTGGLVLLLPNIPRILQNFINTCRVLIVIASWLTIRRAGRCGWDVHRRDHAVNDERFTVHFVKQARKTMRLLQIHSTASRSFAHHPQRCAAS